MKESRLRSAFTTESKDGLITGFMTAFTTEFRTVFTGDVSKRFMTEFLIEFKQENERGSFSSTSMLELTP